MLKNNRIRDDFGQRNIGQDWIVLTQIIYSFGTKSTNHREPDLYN